jgi:hypothetical protein
MESVLEGTGVHLVEFLGRELGEALVRTPGCGVRHAGEIVHPHDVIGVGHDRHRLDEGCQIEAPLVAEVFRLNEAVVLIDDVVVIGVYQERIRCDGPSTRVYVERSDHPGFWVHPRNADVEFHQPLGFELEEYMKSFDDGRAVRVGTVLDV